VLQLVDGVGDDFTGIAKIGGAQACIDRCARVDDMR